ncbi:MAG: hypothetical protein U5Q03_18795 [Bacteroidota bacterium]|nr:hypothetical protein [Bacteroidota bacterium]
MKKLVAIFVFIIFAAFSSKAEDIIVRGHIFLIQWGGGQWEIACLPPFEPPCLHLVSTGQGTWHLIWSSQEEPNPFEEPSVPIDNLSFNESENSVSFTVAEE